MLENIKSSYDKEQSKIILLKFSDDVVKSGSEMIGIISIKYDGRFDSISINSQIEDSSDVFNYTEIEGRKKNHPYARLSIMKKEIKNPSQFEFKIITNHVPKEEYTRVKFRATLIQEHKEIASDIKFLKIVKKV